MGSHYGPRLALRLDQAPNPIKERVTVGKSKFFIILCGVIAAGAAYATLKTTKPQTMTKCRDVRRYMDGAFYATVETSGVGAQTQIDLYALRNLKPKWIQRFSVQPTAHGYIAPQIKLLISKVVAPNGEFKGTLEARVGTENIHTPVTCKR